MVQRFSQPDADLPGRGDGDRQVPERLIGGAVGGDPIPCGIAPIPPLAGGESGLIEVMAGLRAGRLGAQMPQPPLLGEPLRLAGVALARNPMTRRYWVSRDWASRDKRYRSSLPAMIALAHRALDWAVNAILRALSRSRRTRLRCGSDNCAFSGSRSDVTAGSARRDQPRCAATASSTHSSSPVVRSRAVIAHPDAAVTGFTPRHRPNASVVTPLLPLIAAMVTHRSDNWPLVPPPTNKTANSSQPAPPTELAEMPH